MPRSFPHTRRYLTSFVCGVVLSALTIVPVPSLVRAHQDGSRQLKQEGNEQSPGRRLALVIGNGAYQNAPVLKNPANDATDMAKALSELGFTVEHGVDLSQKQMKLMIREFGKKLRDGGQGLFYFSGHGVQLRGRNYLIPVEADIVSETEVEDQGVDASLVLGLMDEANNGLNVVILDACRNNPFAKSFKSASNGLAQVDAPTGTLIAYATAPGRVARDGTGRNGTYTAEFLKQMKVPGLGIEELLKRVRASLKQQTNGEQIPWESSSLVGDFYLNRPTNATSNPVQPTTSGATNSDANSAAFELEYWNAIKDSSDPEEYQGYLAKYPNGRFADIARRRVAGKRGGNNAVTQPDKSTTVPANSKSTKPFRNPKGIEFVWIPPGDLEMGSNNGEADEKPVHRVKIGQGFYMGKYEVTQGQWQAVMGNNPSYFKGDDNLPVEQVSWNDAQEFINKLSDLNDGYKYRLPTEAEWEYACRAGTTGDYYDQDIDAIGWYSENSGEKTHRVGGKQPNAFGLYDMSGNVWEWCRDWYVNTYEGAPTDGSARLFGGEQKNRVLRGGSWYLNTSYLRSARRGIYNPGFRNDVFFGFRLVAVVRIQ